MRDPRSIPMSELESVCLKHRVRALWLFGSTARHDADPSRSDVDCLVEFAALSPVERKNAYFGLRDDLMRMFGRPVDLVEASAVRNPIVLRAIESERVALYAAA